MELKRKELKIMNIIIVILCICSIVGYIVLDFFTLKLKYQLTASDLKTILTKSEDAKNYVDFVDQAMEDGKIVKLEIKISSSLLMGSLKTKNAEEYVNNNFVDKLVDDFIDDMQDVIAALVEVATKSYVKNGFEDYAEDYVKNVLGEETTDEEVKEKLEESGVTEEYINEKTEEFFETLSQEGVSVDDVADEAVKIAEEVFQKVDEGINDGLGEKLSEEDKQTVKDTIKEVLEELCLVDENGNLKDINGDAEDIINQLLGKLNKGNSSKSANVIEQGNSLYKTELFDQATQDENQQEQITLRNEIKVILHRLFNPLSNKIVLAFKIMFFILSASVLLWLWEIIKIILKSHKANPAIRFGSVETLGWLPQFVLGFLPTFAFSLLPKLSNSIAGGSTQILDFASRISFEVFTSGIVASISALILFIISFPYIIIRKRLQKQIKSEQNNVKVQRKPSENNS